MFQSVIERFQDKLESIQDYVGNNRGSAASKGQFCSELGKKALFLRKTGAVTRTPPRCCRERWAVGARTVFFTGYFGRNAGFSAFSRDENVRAFVVALSTKYTKNPNRSPCQTTFFKRSTF
jgi:hypothetical protein